MKKLTHKEFLNKLENNNKSYIEGLFEVVGQYENAKTKILLKTCFGYCKMHSSHLLNNQSPTIVSAICKNEYIRNVLKEVHGELYDYSRIIYKKAREKVEIGCKLHGWFWQSPNSHQKGHLCPDCGREVQRKNNKARAEKSFIPDAKLVHDNFYTYPRAIYLGVNTKLIITCPIHGDFEQTPAAHTKKQGCPECARGKINKYHRSTPTGWSYTKWQKAGEKSKNFDSFKCYIIKCWNEEEEFYKIGKTFKNVISRFYGKNSMPYNYEIIEIFEGEARDMCELEKILQKENKEFKYIPSLKFNGMHECYSNTKTLLKYIKNNNI